jgi:Serine dehydrogenase proteinase
VVLLRSRFLDIRFIVPSFAKSAATMLVMSGDEILMDVTAEVGPTDPQMPTPQGGYAPAGAILDQFEQAKRELEANPAAIAAWPPILQYFGTGLLQQCQNQIALSQTLVSQWLRDYMFRAEPDRDELAL